MKDGKDENMTINEYLPLRDIVFQTLRKSIITGQLSPGERLMEVNLANQLSHTLHESLHRKTVKILNPQYQ